MMVKYHEPVNLGNPDEFTMLELVEVLQTLLKYRIDTTSEAMPMDDPKQRKPDINLSLGITKLDQFTSLSSGLKIVMENLGKR